MPINWNNTTKTLTVTGTVGSPETIGTPGQLAGYSISTDDIEQTGSGPYAMIFKLGSKLVIDGYAKPYASTPGNAATQTILEFRGASTITLTPGSHYQQVANQVLSLIKGNNRTSPFQVKCSITGAPSASGAALVFEGEAWGQIDGPDIVPKGIFAFGSGWSSTFTNQFVDNGGFGIPITEGLTVPTNGVNSIYVSFEGPVDSFNEDTVKLLGKNVADYESVSTYSFNAETKVGRITLSTPIVNDRLTLNILAGVNSSSTSSPEDIIFQRKFKIKVADASADGSTNGGDLTAFANSFNKSVGNVDYNWLADWNGDGSVNGGDLTAFANNFNTSLPNP